MNGLTPALADNLVPLPARIACLDGVRYLGAASFEEDGVELLGLSCLIPAGFPSPACKQRTLHPVLAGRAARLLLRRRRQAAR